MDLDEFEQWLRAKQANEVVGTAGYSCGCPLACYLNQTRGGAWEVDNAVYGESAGFTHTPLPTWAEMFVLVVDQRGEREVTAREAITDLEQVKGAYYGTSD